MTPDATAVQCSMFQATTGPLVSMALLCLDLDEVARRLSLTIEESWDAHGAVRAAFFTLDGTDFVVTHHEGDPPGTYVWVRKSGPVDPAARTAVLLTALGVGTEVVSYSTWGIGTDLSEIPAAWRRSRYRPTGSHQRFWEDFRDGAGMHAGRTTYEGVTAYLSGYDRASGGVLLHGLREWLAATYGVAENLAWMTQVVLIVFPRGRPDSPWSQDQHVRAAERLVALLEEFFQHLQDPAGVPPRTS